MPTTTQRKASTIPITQEYGPHTVLGVREMPVQEVRVAAPDYMWTLYMNARDEWWEECHDCAGGIPYGVCLKCAGSLISRVAGSTATMLVAIRKRAKARTPERLNAVERAEQRQRALAEEWSVQHPNVASDLARERVHGTLGRNVLGDLALAAQRGPLSVKQERYATTLLAERAWEEAHAHTKGPASAHVGSVGEPITVTGTITQTRFLPTSHVGWNDSVVIFLCVDETTLVKITTAAKWARSVAVGDTISVEGVVTAHEDDAYGKRTALRPARLLIS